MARTRILLIHNRPVLASTHPEAASEGLLVAHAQQRRITTAAGRARPARRGNERDQDGGENREGGAHSAGPF